MSRSIVEVEIRKPKSREKDVYVGRFLGFIKDDEFNALIQNTHPVAGRLETTETKALVPLAMVVLDLMGCRFVMTVRSKNGSAVLTKRLFVSGKLDFVSEVLPAQRKIRIATSSGDDIAIVEKEDL